MFLTIEQQKKNPSRCVVSGDINPIRSVGCTEWMEKENRTLARPVAKLDVHRQQVDSLLSRESGKTRVFLGFASENARG